MQETFFFLFVTSVGAMISFLLSVNGILLSFNRLRWIEEVIRYRVIITLILWRMIYHVDPHHMEIKDGLPFSV